jgi:uncharacterized lipoprotein
VTLAELKYQSPKDNLYVTEATIGATFRADVRTATAATAAVTVLRWTSVSAWRRTRKPTPKLVGDVLSDALTRLFKDPTIGQVLGQ